MSPSNMNVGGNKMKSSRFLITTTNISIPPIENEDRSATTIKKGKDVEVKPPAEVSKASMLDNYSSSELRENILGSLKESLMKTIKSSEELNVIKTKKGFVKIHFIYWLLHVHVANFLDSDLNLALFVN